MGLLDAPTRITAPMVRSSWLADAPGAATDRRGTDPFVEVDWDQAESLIAAELDRVRFGFGNDAIYAGSYGWGSAGRMHHSKTWLKRFLNLIGGFTRSVDSYSFASGEVVTRHVFGIDLPEFAFDGPTWPDIADHADLVVCFGGIRLSNGQIGQGGAARHVQRGGLHHAAASGVQFVNVSPIASDLDPSVGPRHLAIRPSTDAALIMGLVHTLIVDGLVDDDFVDAHTTGFERWTQYLLGRNDGIVKDAAWASEICGVSSDEIVALARRMATSKTLVNLAWAITRQQHGEHAWWAGIALAAALGQIGLPGRGLAMGLSSTNAVGNDRRRLRPPAIDPGTNPVETFIPVARIADMLLGPGTEFRYDGQTYSHPDIRLVWWAGGNPFHHHQDLNRLLRGWQKPETIIVNDWTWTATARRADIVLPVATTLERRDIAMTPSDGAVVAMDQLIDPPPLARTDHEIFGALADRMEVGADYHEGRDAEAWLAHLYEELRRIEPELPDLDQLFADGWADLAPRPEKEAPMLSAFRADPTSAPLSTPSGRIEIFSERVAARRDGSGPGYPVWTEPDEWLGARDVGTRLHAITNQPTTMLHSQLDPGAVSRSAKIDGRVVIRMNPADGVARGLATGDHVVVASARGGCHAVVALDTNLRAGVIQMPTGAWFDPIESGVIGSPCAHGNPNTFTSDRGSSDWAQGSTAQTCLVEVSPVDATPPAVRAHEPPEIIRGASS